MSFAISIFFSAFLLFQVQPILAKVILPWYGGTPSVWTTCMVFFQVSLLLGYSYAHFLRSYCSKNTQVLVHILLLLVSISFLPVTPAEALKPDGASDPVNGILYLLLVTVGMPYVMVSATGPLLQHWFDRSTGQSPYRLYALSNFGSLLGLLTYPFVFEPTFTLKSQMLGWSIGYVAFVLACGWSAMVFYKGQEKGSASPDSSESDEKVGYFRPFLWLGLSACGSILLLATTNKITQDVAVVPFLWILPLSLYLVTFIIAFDNPRWYNRYFWIPLCIFLLALSVPLLNLDHASNYWPAAAAILAYVSIMFVGCMVCHGEMVRAKPAPRHLTYFYLMVALGGATGGVFVNLIAPKIFVGYWELHLALVLCVVFVGLAVFRKNEWQLPTDLSWMMRGAWFAATMAFGLFLYENINEHEVGLVDKHRNFYGVLSVVDTGQSTMKLRKLYHGNITHGQQFTNSKLSRAPIAYYGRNSGVGIAIGKHPIRIERMLSKQKGKVRNLKVGMVGEGIGTLAFYGYPGDTFRMYEINPKVDTFARQYFSYLKDARVEIELVLGDGRISLEKELKDDGPQEFDVLVIDAFTGDAIPVHLLTKEAFELYWKHLRTDGILAIHISNRHINLRPVVKRLAQYIGKPVVNIKTARERRKGLKSADWLLVTSNQDFLMNAFVKSQFDEWPVEDPISPLWTDDYSSILKALD